MLYEPSAAVTAVYSRPAASTALTTTPAIGALDVASVMRPATQPDCARSAKSTPVAGPSATATPARVWFTYPGARTTITVYVPGGTVRLYAPPAEVDPGYSVPVALTAFRATPAKGATAAASVTRPAIQPRSGCSWKF